MCTLMGFFWRKYITLEPKSTEELCFTTLKNAFDFEAIPRPSCYLTSIVDKTHHGPVFAPFSVISLVIALPVVPFYHQRCFST